MDRVEFFDWRIALFDRQRAILTRGVEIKSRASFQINFSEIFPSLFDSEQVMAGSIRAVSVFRGSKNQDHADVQLSQLIAWERLQRLGGGENIQLDGSGFNHIGGSVNRIYFTNKWIWS